MLWLLACRIPEGFDPDKVYQPDSAPGSGDLLAELRADRDAALLRQAQGGGWPAPTDDGWLIVCPDCAWPEVAGDFDGWAGTALSQDEGFAWVIVAADPDSGYKFSDGADHYSADPWARSLVYDDYGELSLIAPAGAHIDRVPGFGTGRLQARTIRIWVPEGSPGRTLYAHDGQNLFDPEAIWGGWRLQDNLTGAASEAMAGIMIVGIDNTSDRMEEYTHTADDIGDGSVLGGQAADYAALVEDIRGFVREQYGEPGPVGTMGSSLGGLVSLYLAQRDPDGWDFAASLSGTAGWGSIGLQNPTIIDLMQQAGHQDIAIYLDSGGNGGCYDSDGDGTDDDDPTASDNYCENIQLRDTLAAAGYRYDTDLWHWWEPGAPHNEAAWAERVHRPLEIFSGL